MIKEFLETNFDASFHFQEAFFLVPVIHQPYFEKNLGNINQKISRETLQVLGRTPKTLKEEEKKSVFNVSEDEIESLKKSNPCFYRYKKTSPFCLCYYNEKQSLACHFCRFACCAKAQCKEMMNSLIECKDHGTKRIEEDFRSK